MARERDDDYVERETFDEFKDSVGLRFADQSKRVDGVQASGHELRNRITPLFALEGRVNEMIDDLKNFPRRDDLVHLSQTLTAKIDSIEKAREERQETIRCEREKADKRLLRWIAILGIALSALTLVLKVSKIG